MDSRRIVPAAGHRASRLSWATATVFGSFVLATMATADDDVLVPREPWSNFFADAPVELTYDVAAQDARDATAQWTLAVDERTVDSRMASVQRDGDAIAKVAVAFDAPEVRPGIVLGATLTVVLREAGQSAALASHKRTLWFFPRDPFADRGDWLAERKITLFDPSGRTARHFEESSIPFQPTKNIDALENLAEGMIIVGEGVSARDYRALGAVLSKAASAGRPVLWLAPAAGQFPFPGTDAADLPQPSRVTLARQEIILELDKRLDAASWPSDGKAIASGLLVRGEGRRATAEAVAGEAGWPWLEAEYPGGGRLLIASFALVDHWDHGPAPRYLLLRMLERLAGEPPAMILNNPRRIDP